MFVWSKKQMALILYSLFAFLCTNRADGATHWVVTEDGRIQSQMDSLFNLNRPYDLMAMLKQEDRARVLEDLKQELLMRKEHIDRNEDRDSGLEQRFYRTDSDCIAAGKPLPEYDLYISTVLPLENKGIRPEEHIDFRAPAVPQPISPVCTDMTDLDFSMDAFEHLEGVKHRENLTGSPELGLKNAITHRENVDDYGHLVYEALKKNKTSWVLYNMAAFYWRIKGHPYNVVECVRRALHYSPRSHRDVALISLANILHRARYSNEAAIIVNAALEVSKDLNVNHFTLGNIYAVLAEYNRSVVCFEDTLMIQPDFEAAELRRHAVLCHAKLEEALESQHRSLQQTLTDLKDYQEKHEFWQKMQERVLAEQAPSEVKFDQRVGYESFKIRRMSQGVGEYCRMEDKDGRQILQCSWARKALAQNDKEVLGTWTQVRDTPKTETGSSTAVPAALMYHEPVRAPKFTVKNLLTEDEEAKLQYKDSEWPNKEECDIYVQKFPAWNEFPTTYLPPENKGFEVRLLLSEAQDLKDGVQHSLPWYPPKCNLAALPDSSKTYDFLQSVQERAKLAQKIVDSSMKTVLLDLVHGDTTEEEIGQRILTALKKEIGPQWMLYNLAALYWRTKGGTEQGIDCLRYALYYVPASYKDVPLVNLANLLYKLGRVDDSLTLMKEAIAINDMEPETHFFLGNVLAAKGNISGATHHYDQALLQDPDHSAAFSSLRSLKCYYKYHRTAQSAAPIPKDPPPGQSCSQSCTATCNNNNKAKCNGKGQIESRLICKNENGRESCVVETSTPNCEHGPCTQTCSISPLSVETCEGPGGIKCLGHNINIHEMPADGSTPKCQGSTDNCRQASTLGPMSDTLGPNPMADPDFFDKMEAVKEYYRHRGLCVGDDCQKYLVQCITPTKTEGDVESFVAQHFVYDHPTQPPPAGQQCLQQPQQHRPHTKLEIQNGVLHQKLILVDSPEDIVVGPNDCVIYNDGRKTPGCQKEEYRSFQDFEELSKLMSQINAQDDSHGNKMDTPSENISKKDKKDKISQPPPKTSSPLDPNMSPPIDSNPEAQHSDKANSNSKGKTPATEKSSKDTQTIADNKNINDHDYWPEDEEIFDDEESELSTFDWDEENAANKEKVVKAEAPPPAVTKATAPPVSRQLQENLMELTDEQLFMHSPDPMRHITEVTNEPWPTWEQCRLNYPDINFQLFSSTWVSVTTKNIDMTGLLDLDTPVKGNLQEPLCHHASQLAQTPLDVLPSLQDLHNLPYDPEWGLREILQKLGSEVESLGVVGTRISRALKKKPTSWALANLAALYWRVDGDAARAFQCIKVAHQMAPPNAKDIALLSLVNILHYVGALEEALLVCDMALEAEPKLVATHFTMANIYAAREEWGRARKFYESTLGLQASFHPAKDRLYSLRCQKVLSNPHIYRSTTPESGRADL